MSNDHNQSIYTALKLLNIVEVDMRTNKYGDKALINKDLVGKGRIEVIYLYAVRFDYEPKYRINNFIPPEDDKIDQIFHLISQLDFS